MSALKSLTQQQLRIFMLMAANQSTKQCAGELGISVKTAEYHWALVKRKLGIHTQVQAAHLALHLKIISNLFD